MNIQWSVVPMITMPITTFSDVQIPDFLGQNCRCSENCPEITISKGGNYLNSLEFFAVKLQSWWSFWAFLIPIFHRILNTIGMTSEYKWRNARLWRTKCLSQTCVGDQYHLWANFIYDSHKLIDPIIYFTAKPFIIFLLNFQFQAFHICKMRQLFTEVLTDCIYIHRCWYGEQR